MTAPHTLAPASVTPTAIFASPPRVVVAHDYTTQRGGAERVALALLQAFPGSRLLTSTYNPKQTFPAFAEHQVDTLWINRITAFRRDPRLAFPFLARAWEEATVTDADLVICSSSGWSHGVTTDSPKYVYCHNPARWLYQPGDYIKDAALAVRLGRRALARKLTAWDARRAESATGYIANSTCVAGRVLEAYGRDALVIPPAVTLDPHAVQEPVPGIAPGFLLTVARARGYKNVEAVCAAVAASDQHRLVVIGDLPSQVHTASDGRVRALSHVSDAQLRWLYANCAALVSAAHEDFGLTPLEANLFGKPVLVLRAGGFLDSVVEGVTGAFFDVPTAEAIRDAIQRIPNTDPEILSTYAQGFRTEAFAQKIREAVFTSSASESLRCVA